MHTELPCVGVVLAGGQSRRMGRDKALLTWQGQSLLARQMACLHAAGADDVVVSGERPEQGGIADVAPGTGPVGGLVSVMQHVQQDAQLLVVPVDMPCLGADLLQRLRRELAQAACVAFVDKVLPMRLRGDAAARDVLQRIAQTPQPRQRSLRALQQRLDCARLALSPAESGQLLDCNTPSAWKEANECGYS